MPQFRTDSPAILYKYRADIARDVKCLLVDRRLFLAPPLALNDPFDCFPAIAVPVVGDHEAFIASEMAKAPPGYDPAEVRTRCHRILTSEVDRQRFLKEFYREDLGRLGILSLSASRDQPLLWAHYAKNGAGFAVGYRARDEGEFEALGGVPVRYSTRRPVMSPFGEEDWLGILFTKSNHWSYEQEWRYVRMIEDGGVGMMTVPPNSIAEVCLGPKMTSNDSNAVIRAARALPDQPRIVQAELDRESYGLKFVELN